METPEQLYLYFVAALRLELFNRGRGAVKEIALAAGISSSFLSQVKSPKSVKKASPDLQRSLAAALGFEYADFLDWGRGAWHGENDNKIERRRQKVCCEDLTIEAMLVAGFKKVIENASGTDPKGNISVDYSDLLPYLKGVRNAAKAIEGMYEGILAAGGVDQKELEEHWA